MLWLSVSHLSHQNMQTEHQSQGHRARTDEQSRPRDAISTRLWCCSKSRTFMASSDEPVHAPGRTSYKSQESEIGRAGESGSNFEGSWGGAGIEKSLEGTGREENSVEERNRRAIHTNHAWRIYHLQQIFERNFDQLSIAVLQQPWHSWQDVTGPHRNVDLAHPGTFVEHEPKTGLEVSNSLLKWTKFCCVENLWLAHLLLKFLEKVENKFASFAFLNELSRK